MRKFLTITLMFSLFIAKSQDLLTSRKNSCYTYIYKITTQEAQHIYQNQKQQLNESVFHTLIDSFSTDKGQRKKLAYGHYIQFSIKKEKMEAFVMSVQPFDVFVLNNNTDLCIQLRDTVGNIISNAAVNINSSLLKFDKKVQAYRDKKSNKQGLLEIEYNNEKFYFSLCRDQNNPKARRFTNKLLYTFPVKYVWKPVKYIVRLPIDGVKSIKKHQTYGTIQRTKSFFVKLYNKTACFLNHSNCDDYKKDYKSYLVFNKPKYFPGDTVKFKSFITDEKGKPLKETVKLIFDNGRNKRFEIASVKPYRKGAYEYQFYLHDSLQLKLDNHCNVYLMSQNKQYRAIGSFKYEEYELSSVNLSIRTSGKSQYRGKDFAVFVSGKDENDLNLTDARVELLILTKRIVKYFDTCMFVPATIFKMTKKLEINNETAIIIPDSVFPNANMVYELKVRLLSSDNDLGKKSKEITFYHKKQEIKMEISSDSLYFTYSENDIEKQIPGRIYEVDNFGNKTKLSCIKLPFQAKVNPYYSHYKVIASDIEQNFSLSSKDALIKCFSEITRDSIQIVINNPRNLHFNYFIYKLNKEVAKGYTTQLNWKHKTRTKSNYYISLQFLWGGEIIDKTFEIGYNKRKLLIELEQPTIVYPGQKATIKVKVTDDKGKPVPGVDLTAYSMTRKFRYSIPPIPVFDDYKKEKEYINSFEVQNILDNALQTGNLDYDKWKEQTGLDTIEYYKFIFPGEKIYRFSYTPMDKKTQFAPFVVNNGQFEPIQVIYVDMVPVYFSWSDNITPYSFKIDSGFHHIRLRTKHKEYYLDKFYFPGNQKLIFSLSDSIKEKKITIQHRDSALTEEEKNNLYKYIFPLYYNQAGYFSYLEQDNDVIYLKPKQYRGYSGYQAGPVLPKQSVYNLLGHFKTIFNHEPFWQYEFLDGIIKMRSMGRNNYHVNFSKTACENITDSLMTRNYIEREGQNYLKEQKYNSFYKMNPNQYYNTKLHFDFTETPNLSEWIILIRGIDDYYYNRLEPKNTYSFSQNKNEKYQLIFIEKESEKAIYDTIELKPNGFNYFKLKFAHANESTKTFSESLPEILRAEHDNFTMLTSKIEESVLIGRKKEKISRIISGKVVDYNNQPICGATVLIEGTWQGTLTNIDGEYSIKVDSLPATLSFRYMGMTIDNAVIGKNRVDVIMTNYVFPVQEIVVIGYGVVRKSLVTGSISTVQADEIQGIKYKGVDASSSNQMQKKGNGIIISGNKDTSGPLYVINGSVYSGDQFELDKDKIQTIEVLKDAGSYSIYGARSANGVILITTKKGFLLPQKKGAEYDNAFYKESMSQSKIRSNFSDYAFWKPRLFTDNQGIASFEVTFPDDVTNWGTYYIAMNDKRQSGKKEAFIKSYKPLISQLAIPRFFTEGDDCYIIGKAKNYTTGSIELQTKLEQDDSLCFNRKNICMDVLIDTMKVHAGSKDSINLRYSLQTEEGYFDGEQKAIPVFPIGLEETKGKFLVLDKDSTISMDFDTTLLEVNLYAKANELDVIKEEIGGLINYKYACNEQLASKLKGLLAYKRICIFNREEFKYEEIIKAIIQKLIDNQQNNGCWGWWNRNGLSYWISIHALEALYKAREMGYEVKLNPIENVNTLVWELQKYPNMRILKLLRKLEVPIDYQKYIKKINLDEISDYYNYFHNQLMLYELRQMCDMPIPIDSILIYSQHTLFGSLYFAREKADSRHFYENEVQNTLIAYRILRNDSTFSRDSLIKIRNYLFEKRSNGNWLNTYESAQIIETILPDILDSTKKTEKTVLNISGDINKKVEKFPFETKLKANQKIKISKTGTYPVYLTAYQRYWNKKPKAKSNDFSIETRFAETEIDSILISGKSYTLQARVHVKKDAEYVMVEVPIPASCSYEDKSNQRYWEVHREYFKNKVSIFCERLSAGSYTFNIKVIPRYTGKYTLNPAKVELMYFPTFNANNEIKKVVVE